MKHFGNCISPQSSKSIRQRFLHFAGKYQRRHRNNISAGIGGPIVPHHQSFFFFSIESPFSTAANNASIKTFEDPAFIQFAKTAFPNAVGTSIASICGVAELANTTVSKTAAQRLVSEHALVKKRGSSNQ